LSHLLSYLCEKTFAGQTDQIKEYSVALEVFHRSEAFDQDTDSIVRVQANRLRKRLSEYYAGEGLGHEVHITIPVGQYVPSFPHVPAASTASVPVEVDAPAGSSRGHGGTWIIAAIVIAVCALGLALFLAHSRAKPHLTAALVGQEAAEPNVGLPVGDEVHLLAGATRRYVDHAGKLWDRDAFFDGGTAVQSSVQHIWRTPDPIIYRSSRQGDFTYNIPLKPGTYELRLHFAENFYGPENAGGGGEGSRMMTVSANGQILIHDFDVLADAGGERTAEVKVFPDISPAQDGQLHLAFSGQSSNAMLSGIEILPGIRGQLRPVRIIARDVPYYSNDSRWWSPDTYFKGGQLSTSHEPALGTDDPEFYESERWGHFSYGIPVAPGKYTIALHFIEHEGTESVQSGSGTRSEDRVFTVFCNGRTVISNLNIADEVGNNHPLTRKIKNLEPNAQGKLLLEFVPVTGYATVTAIELMEE
jgi:hypothetical protein